MADLTGRLNAALEGRYRIERMLGEGGMATVYLADDLKHDRKVALKVLKPELAAVLGAERFLSEIKVTANLQHPHILPLFDSGEADKLLFYVMPHVEGESLRERLEREAQLPVNEAVAIATKVAGALQHAHERGVIHRDIKPANILLQDGEPVVADFGIALAMTAAGGTRITETGLSVGTPYYMSPEQATGDQEVEPPSDIYALACVLYEMLVGDPPYLGRTAKAVLGQIIAGEAVSATKRRSSIPANVDAAIRRALEKLPADRFTGAQDFAKALADAGFRHRESATEAVGVVASGPWNRVSVVGWSVAVLATLTLGWSLLRPAAPEPPRPVSRYSRGLPVTQRGDGFGSSLAVSPDGAQIVYVAQGEQGPQLWLRRRDQLQATPIVGTAGDGVINPVFSPDGQRVAFYRTGGGSVSAVSLAGGPPLAIAESGVGAAALAWGPDGYIYVDADVASGGAIGRVPETSGEVEQFTVLDTAQSETGHNWPQALPNGRGVLFTVTHQPYADDSQYDIAVADLETGEHEVLVRGVFARYAASGHLVYPTADGTLLAAPFDQDAMQLTGPAVALAEGIGVRPFGSVHLALSDDGTLVYQAGSALVGGSELVWVTRSGQATPVDDGFTFVPGGGNYGWRLSPDGTRVAFNDLDGDVWIKHLPDGPVERLTFVEDFDYRPFWTPDGQSVTYFSGPASDDRTVRSRRADGTGERQLVLDDERSFSQGSWSPDGEWLLLRAAATAATGLGLRDILAFRPGVDSVAVPLVATAEFAEGEPAFSPDGRWLAYSSDETGRREVFVRPFPDVGSTRVRVSTNGGLGPLWAHSGRELFFMDEERGLVAAEFDPVAGQVRAQETLFTIPPGYSVFAGANFYDVTSDDQRFLMARLYEGDAEGPATQVIVVENFFEELRERVGG